MLTMEHAVSVIYDQTAAQHMRLARMIRENAEWCRKNMDNFDTIKAAFEKVLEIRDVERAAVCRYYYQADTKHS